MGLILVEELLRRGFLAILALRGEDILLRDFSIFRFPFFSFNWLIKWEKVVEGWVRREGMQGRNRSIIGIIDNIENYGVFDIGLILQGYWISFISNTLLIQSQI